MQISSALLEPIECKQIFPSVPAWELWLKPNLLMGGLCPVAGRILYIGWNDEYKFHYGEYIKYFLRNVKHSILSTLLTSQPNYVPPVTTGFLSNERGSSADRELHTQHWIATQMVQVSSRCFHCEARGKCSLW